MSRQPFPGSTEWGRIVHLFVEGAPFAPGRTFCGRTTQLVAPPDPDGRRCLGCFPAAALRVSSKIAGARG